MLRGTNKAGFDTDVEIDDEIIEKYVTEEGKEEDVHIPLPEKLTVLSIMELEKKGYKSIGTGFYKDSEHHLWKIEKEGDNYSLVRAYGEDEKKEAVEEDISKSETQESYSVAASKKEAEEHTYEFVLPVMVSVSKETYDENDEYVEDREDFTLADYPEFFDTLKEDFNESELEQYVRENLVGVVTSIRVDRLTPDEDGVIIKVETSEKLTPEGQEAVIDYIEGQASDGWGEGFEQLNLSKSKSEEVSVHTWWRKDKDHWREYPGVQLVKRKESETKKAEKYPTAIDLEKVGEYPVLVNSGGGYVYDDVLEYRVWERDEFTPFASYKEALEFSTITPGAETPLVLVLQKEYIEEAEEGNFELKKGPRMTEWKPEWLEESKRTPKLVKQIMESKEASKKKAGSYEDFLSDYGPEIKEALRYLKAISKVPEGDITEEVVTKLEEVTSPYDPNVAEFIAYNMGDISAKELARFAINNLNKYGTEPRMVLEAIERVYDTLVGEGTIKRKAGRWTDKTYEDVAKESKLPSSLAKIFVSYMKERWTDSEDEKVASGYAHEWAERFMKGIEWDRSDSTSRAVLKELAPDLYPPSTEAGRKESVGADPRNTLGNYLSRKPLSLDEVNEVSYRDLSDDERTFIETLPTFTLKELGIPFDNILVSVKRELPQFFLLREGGNTYIVDTQGYNYMRYIGKLVDPDIAASKSSQVEKKAVSQELLDEVDAIDQKLTSEHNRKWLSYTDQVFSEADTPYWDSLEDYGIQRAIEFGEKLLGLKPDHAASKKTATADSELFVDELIADELRAQGIGFRRIEVPEEWKGMWGASDYPDKGIAKVLDDEDNVIGTVSWKTKFNIEKGFSGRYVEAEPSNVKFHPTKQKSSIVENHSPKKKRSSFEDSFENIVENLLDRAQETAFYYASRKFRAAWEYVIGNIHAGGPMYIDLYFDPETKNVMELKYDIYEPESAEKSSQKVIPLVEFDPDLYGSAGDKFLDEIEEHEKVGEEASTKEGDVKTDYNSAAGQYKREQILMNVGVDPRRAEEFAEKFKTFEKLPNDIKQSLLEKKSSYEKEALLGKYVIERPEGDKELVITEVGEGIIHAIDEDSKEYNISKEMFKEKLQEGTIKKVSRATSLKEILSEPGGLTEYLERETRPEMEEDVENIKKILEDMKRKKSRKLQALLGKYVIERPDGPHEVEITEVGEGILHAVDKEGKEYNITKEMFKDQLAKGTIKRATVLKKGDLVIDEFGFRGIVDGIEDGMIPEELIAFVTYEELNETIPVKTSSLTIVSVEKKKEEAVTAIDEKEELKEKELPKKVDLEEVKHFFDHYEAGYATAEEMEAFLKAIKKELSITEANIINTIKKGYELGVFDKVFYELAKSVSGLTELPERKTQEEMSPAPKEKK